ncbi:electron transfer flavoprotein subunit beta, partial [candidate division KSB3 bacterium]|nr:electron transfer flavoprotein subunit beta [candidate division KSB3 bacterium]MBD3326704.1 electron transfer flavoprotein subunit beta [candidate division KSB3 bacterium]
SDTWATSYVLSETIKQHLPDFDLILCGERATDGDTGQVGPGIAAHLDLPLATYVSKIQTTTNGDGNTFHVERLVEGGYEVLSGPFPALLTVVKEISFPRLPTLRGKQKAKKVEIPVITPETLTLPEDCIGLSGSPTQVVKIFRPQISRQGEKYTIKEEPDLEQAIDRLIAFLQQKNLM